MPGIVGYVGTLPGRQAEALVDRMRAVMLYEAHFTSGQHAAPEAFACVGWVGHRGGLEDHLPLASEHDGVSVVLVGEFLVDAAKGLFEPASLHQRHVLGARLAEAYRQHDYAFPSALSGRFAGVLLDRRRRRCLWFGDRFGMHRLFYARRKEGVLFASEAKALLRVLPECREFDPAGLVELVTCGCTLGERSPYRGIEILQGGTSIECEAGHWRGARRYFDITEWAGAPPLTADAFNARFRDEFPVVVGDHLGCGPTAMSMTGGLDSRMVIAAADPQPGALPCYTFGSPYRDTFDVKVSREVAAACAQPHTTITLGSSFLGDIPQYLEGATFRSDGYLGLSGAAELYANARAREVAPARITGNYGGELLRGVRAFRCEPAKAAILDRELQPLALETSQRFLQLARMPGPSFVALVQAPHQGFGRLAIESSQVVVRNPFMDDRFVQCCHEAPPTLDGVAFARRALEAWYPPLATIPTDRGLLGAGGSGIQLARHLWRGSLFKAEYLVSHGMPDVLTRMPALRRATRIEQLLLGRHKFYHLRHWSLAKLEDYARTLLLADRAASLSDIVDTRRLAVIVSDHFSQKRNAIGELDLLLTLASSRKRLLSGG